MGSLELFQSGPCNAHRHEEVKQKMNQSLTWLILMTDHLVKAAIQIFFQVDILISHGSSIYFLYAPSQPQQQQCESDFTKCSWKAWQTRYLLNRYQKVRDRASESPTWVPESECSHRESPTLHSSFSQVKTQLVGYTPKTDHMATVILKKSSN